MWAAIFILVVALLLIVAAPKPKVENARAASLGDFQFPRSREGDPVPWFLGTVKLKSPVSLWYGDFKPVAITKKQKTGLFSSKRVTVGYKYYIGLDLCWALGGQQGCELLRLWAGKYDVWQGSLTTASTITISLPDLFGGENERGGLLGNIDFYPGTFNETRNSYLAQKADPDVPAYIGQCRTVFRGYQRSVTFPWGGSISLGESGFYFGNAISIEPISAEMRRLTRNVHPTYSVMPNGFDVNPMELLYQGFTERFGMPGVSVNDIDLPSWQACAQTLYNEGFGMSLVVQQSITGKDLCEEVLRIADGILYQDTNTGKIIAKLIRDDYDIATLPVLDKTIVRELNNFSKTTWEQTYNQCRVKFRDRENDYADRAATAQDFANINFQQRVKNTDISIPGCYVNEEASNLAVRQLSLLSIPLFQIEIRCNRRASNLKPGDVFVFEWEPYGITNMVMRVQRIDKGTLQNGVVSINAVQDRFATALAVFAPPSGSGWTPINTDAQPVAVRRIEEVPYWFAQFASTLPTDEQGLLMALASPPGNASVNFAADYTTTSDTNWDNPTNVLEGAPYYGSGLLVAEYANTAARDTGIDAVGFTLELVDLPQSIIDGNGNFDSTGSMLLLMNGEYMACTNVTDNQDGTYTFSGVRRALLDSAFETHALGSRCYFVRQADGILDQYLANASGWKVRLIDSTPVSTLDPELATENTVAMTQRMLRPAPPDYVTINGSRLPADVGSGDEVTLAWRSRNRKTTAIVPYNAANEAAEPGTDYGWRYRVNGGAWSGFTYVPDLTDTHVVDTLGLYEFEVWSRRDGLLSRTGDTCSIEVIATHRITTTGDRRVTTSGNARITE